MTSAQGPADETGALQTLAAGTVLIIQVSPMAMFCISSIIIGMDHQLHVRMPSTFVRSTALFNTRAVNLTHWLNSWTYIYVYA